MCIWCTVHGGTLHKKPSHIEIIIACIYIYIHIARISMANVSYRFHFNMFHCLTRCTTSTTINNRTRQADHVDVEIESVTLNNLMIRGAFGDQAVEPLKKFGVSNTPRMYLDDASWWNHVFIGGKQTNANINCKLLGSPGLAPKNLLSSESVGPWDEKSTPRQPKHDHHVAVAAWSSPPIGLVM